MKGRDPPFGSYEGLAKRMCDSATDKGFLMIDMPNYFGYPCLVILEAQGHDDGADEVWV
jgi:hypothetical protein